MNGGSRRDRFWLLAIVVLALVIRIYFPWPLVFSGGHVNMLETDAWYHLRVIENLVHQFPHRLRFDPYAAPAGRFVAAPPLFDLLVGGVAWLAGFGRPSPALVAAVAVFAAPALAALTVIGVYLVARLRDGSLAGLLAAALAATLPGHFLDRTRLGYADHHALESFVSIVVLYLLARPLIRPPHAIRSGLWLGFGLAVFRLSWTSAAMFVAVVLCWLLAHVALQSWRRGIGGAARITGIAAIAALPVTLLSIGMEPFGAYLHVVALVLLAFAAAAVEVASHGLHAGWWSRRHLFAFVPIAGVVAVAAVIVMSPATAGAILDEVSRFRIAFAAGSVTEARPLFFMGGEWSLSPMWRYFGSGFALGLGALVFLAARWARSGEATDLLLIVWTGAMYLATLGQNRFGYYLVPAIAIVAGIASARLISAARRAGGRRGMVAVIGVAAAGFGLNLVPAIAMTVRGPEVRASWLPAFDWLRVHADEPFGDPAYYYARYDPGPARQAASTVMAWWDDGYALIAAAHRVPVAVPTQAGAVEAARFFVATDEARGLELLGKFNSRYVLVDESLPFDVAAGGALVGKFQAMARWAGVPETKYFDTFFFREGSIYRPIYLFFEEYYRSMTFRLGALGGQRAVPANSTAVVSWTIQDVPGVGLTRVVSLLEPAATYEAAMRRISQLGSGNHAIVGRDPRLSAVPLEPLAGLRRAYATPAAGAFRQGAAQVFERVPEVR